MKKILLIVLLLFTSTIVFPQDVSIELFKDGFNDPLNLQHANDDRLFVVEQGGSIKIIQANGTVNTTPFLNISSQVSNGNVQGLLGLAFHPEYATNGYFFVNYTKTNGDTQVSRFSVDPANADLANPNSELPIISYAQPFVNHNGGNMAFGPDGYLYISSGDGGSGGDPGNRAQNRLLLLGKILRLNVNNSTVTNPYEIPADNPFVGNPDALDEIWAYGLRNPWRFSFDLTDNNLWIADVGQLNIEEINRVPVSDAGLNYGWRCFEGTQVYQNQNCPPIQDLTFPIAEYHTSGNCSITGGYVYRGTEYSDIAGFYFFANYCSGLIGTVDNAGTIIDHGDFSGNWVSFGEDINKNLYIIDLGGSIYKVKGGVLAGTENFSVENELAIYPNPTSQNVTFSLKNNFLKTIQLYDIRGSLVFSEENISSKEKMVSIENLNSGVYFAKIISEKGESVTKKLII